MSKKDMIHQLQHLLTSMKEEMISLESNIRVLSEDISENKFISEITGRNVIRHLTVMEELESELKKGYAALEAGAEIPDLISELESFLSEKERDIADKQIRLDAVHAFLTIHSAEPEVELLLEGHKKEIKEWNIGEMTPEEWKASAEKYVDFLAVLEENDPLKLVEYIQKLSACFENELITCAVFKRNFTYTKEEDTAEKTAACGENPDLMDEDAAMAVTLSEDLFETEEESEVYGAPTPFCLMKNAGILVPETGELIIERSPRADKKFGTKEFKNDMARPGFELRRKIITEAYTCGGITAGIISYMTKKTLDIIRDEIENLVKHGYMEGCEAVGMGGFFSVSARGLKAFESESTASVLEVRAEKEGVILPELSRNYAITRLLMLKAVAHICWKRELKHFCIPGPVPNDFFVLKINPSGKADEWDLYTGIVTDREEECEKYFRCLKDAAAERTYRFCCIVGIDSEHAGRLADIITAVVGKELNYRLISYEDADEESEESLGGDAERKVEEPDPCLAASNGRLAASQSCAAEEMETGERAVAGKNIGRDLESTYQNMICEGKIYCATAYLKAAAKLNGDYQPVYRKLAYAVNDPMEKCSYISDEIFSVYFDDNSVSAEYYMASAILRNYFMDHIGYDYGMQQLHNAAKGYSVISRDSYLSKVIYELLEFKEKIHSGIDKYADYRRKDKVIWDSKVSQTRSEAYSYYEAYVMGKAVERASHKRFLETRKLVFSPDGDLSVCLKAAADDDRETLPLVKDYLLETFIKEGALVDSANIDKEKISVLLDDNWNKAGQTMMVVRKTSDLMSSLRMNLYKQVNKVVKVLCDWVYLMEHAGIDENDEGSILYKKIRRGLLDNMNASIRVVEDEIDTLGADDKEECAGRKVLLYTLKELRARLEGSYGEADQYFYINFLKNDKVLLDSDYLPDMDSDIPELPETLLLNCIEAHAVGTEPELEDRLRVIFNGGDDYGSARLIMQYLKIKTGSDLSDEYDIEAGIEYAEKAMLVRKDEFIENLELAQSYGQIENTSEDKKDKILQVVNEWYERTLMTKNFGFFSKLLSEFQFKIRKEAKGREDSIRKELEIYLDTHRQIIREEEVKRRVEKIQGMIELQNYTVAEDLISRLINDEAESEIELLQTDYLQEFIRNYDYNYKSVIDAGRMLRTLVTTTARAQKDTKGGRRLLDNWLTNGGHLGEQKLRALLETTGFEIRQIKEQTKLSGKIENYNVLLLKPENGRKSNYKHPIAAFGSKATEEGFRVVCLYGKYDADRLIDMFKEIGNAKHTIVLLDFPLSGAERRRLARKVKAEVPEKIFGIIDRVVLMYLVNNYAETSINRMLMAIMMPYAYYQPYVVESANIMPPEIFIGRKEELHKIESSTGVNIVYGGRQLGKSALLRMAKSDINENENGDRAVLVDIKGLDYRQAALKISRSLSDENVFFKETETDNWDVLARELKRRLQDPVRKIPYLLLLMDEADAFIESCEEVNYRPFDSLKDVQSIGADRFKFVVAGLRNIVRFKRDIALSNNSVLTHLDSITVTPFKVTEARELLEIPLFYLGIRFPREKDALVSMILATTNYFPGLLQMYCAKLLEAMKKRDYAGYNENDTPPYEVQEKHIKKVLSEAGFQQQIREKFMITLKVGEDDYYYIIALLIAYLYHTDRSKNGYGSRDIAELGKEFNVGKIQRLSGDNVEALMEEMRELNVLRITSDKKYLFTRYSFFQMMGTVQQIEEEILDYMGG